MRRSERIFGWTFIGILVLLAAVGHWARRGAERTCAYDGGKIEPLYRVRFVSEEGDREFCCLRCAELWLRGDKVGPRSVTVTDEASGTEINAAAAHYVRSLVVTNRTTGNRIHAFMNEHDAAEHARSVGGRLLQADERPFAVLNRP